MKLSYGLILLLLFCSCKKTTLVEIQAQDYITGDGSAYAGMEYAVAETWTPFLEVKSKIIASGFLDQNGHAFFDLRIKNNRKYILSVSQPDNVCFGGVQQYYLKHEENNDVNFKYAACSHLKLVVNNTSCINEFDEIKYKRTWLTGNEEGTEIVKLGCYYFEGSFFEVPAGEYRYDWTVTKNSIISSFSQDFTILGGDSVVFQIDY